MNREMKFRAWDKKTKKMRFVNSIAFHFEGEAFDYDSSHLPKVVNLWGTQIIGEYAPKSVLLHREASDVVLMQYTSLTNNGQEWYDGDILENDTDWYQIAWDEDQACWEAIGIWPTGESLMLSELLSSETWVQGNIYENPELLTPPDTKHE